MEQSPFGGKFGQCPWKTAIFLPFLSLPVDISEISRGVKRAFENAERIMYRRELGAEDAPGGWILDVATVRKPSHRRGALAEEVPVRAFEDPVLRDPKQRLAPRVRLWQAGMLRTVHKCRGSVPLFTVVKKKLESGRLALRLVFDLRELSKLFRTPPWSALGGPSPVAGIDVSEEVGAGWRLEGASEDIPDFLYRLGIPEVLSDAFVFSGVSPEELAKELVRLGWRGAMPNVKDKYLAFCIAPMGWIWAVWVAQEATSAVCEPAMRKVCEDSVQHDEGVEDTGPAPAPSGTESVGDWADAALKAGVIGRGEKVGELGQAVGFAYSQVPEDEVSDGQSDYEEGLPMLDKSRLLVHGAPLPLFGRRRRRRAVYSLYVDDFIVLRPECDQSPETIADAKRLQDLLTQALIKAGFAAHKEADGRSLAVTGVIVGGDLVGACPVEMKRWGSQRSGRRDLLFPATSGGEMGGECRGMAGLAHVARPRGLFLPRPRLRLRESWGAVRRLADSCRGEVRAGRRGAYLRPLQSEVGDRVLGDDLHVGCLPHWRRDHPHGRYHQVVEAGGEIRASAGVDYLDRARHRTRASGDPGPAAVIGLRSVSFWGEGQVRPYPDSGWWPQAGFYLRARSEERAQCTRGTLRRRCGGPRSLTGRKSHLRAGSQQALSTGQTRRLRLRVCSDTRRDLGKVEEHGAPHPFEAVGTVSGV